jgi:hypothetical protein
LRADQRLDGVAARVAGADAVKAQEVIERQTKQMGGWSRTCST